jgi:hypothetical protein
LVQDALIREIGEHGDGRLKSSGEELVRAFRGSLSWDRFSLYREITSDKDTPADEVPSAHVIWTFAFDCITGKSKSSKSPCEKIEFATLTRCVSQRLSKTHKGMWLPSQIPGSCTDLPEDLNFR